MGVKLIERALFGILKAKVQPGKVVVLLGARRVGKTELIKAFLDTQDPADYLFLNGEDQTTALILSNKTIANYERLLADKTLLVIDEAQQIEDIGEKLKLIVDSLPEVAIIATGSSVFDLSQKMGEPLVGRQKILKLFPLAQLELKANENMIQTLDNLEMRLLFGGYPELEHLESWEDKSDYLEGIVNDYLLKDILAFNNLRKAGRILDLLRLVALQIGKEVSLDELANSLKGISRNTIEQYLGVLEKVFVIYRVGGFSRNLRKEVVKSSRWYFYDNGIRNAVLRNFTAPTLRLDAGMLWENYIMAERIKRNAYLQHRNQYYFWRTYDQQEIDLVEETPTQLHAFEFKWNPKKLPRAPLGWTNNYPDATFEVIQPQNYLDFIGG